MQQCTGFITILNCLFQESAMQNHYESLEK